MALVMEFPMQKKLLIAILILMFLSLTCGFAGTTGKIMGTVLDSQTGDPVIGANIYLDGLPIGAATNEDGDYFILNIPPGEYTVVVSAIGYATIKESNVEVSTDRTTPKSFKMSPEAIAGEEVVVVGTRPSVEKDRTTTVSYLSSRQIESLPVQEVSDVIQLQTGVVKDASGNFHIRGGRKGEIAYLVDGVPVTDQFRGGSSIELENTWINELQVISGTFNAEYGQAQSGIINIVTKEGAKKFGGKVIVSSGDYVSSHNDIFMNIDKVNLNEQDYSLNFYGPMRLLPGGSFYTSVRFNSNEGWLSGVNRVRIEDTVPIQAFMHEAQQSQTNEERLIGIKVPDSLQTGDGSYVAMNPNRKFSFYGKLSTLLFPSLKVNYSLFYNSGKWKSYSDYHRYSPDGVPTSRTDNFNHILSINHTLSKRTFYSLSLSYYSKNNKSYLYENPLDSRYQGSPYAYEGFAFGGTSNGRSDITNSAIIGKLDVTNQLDLHNQIKFGGEVKRHNIDYSYSSTISDGPVYLAPNLTLPAANTSGNNSYQHSPLEAALYVQDKVELNELIVNAGVRYDYWDPNATVPVDPEATTKSNDGIRLDTKFEKAKIRSQLSPRIGLAYSISSQGVIHVSYGHFFQLPRFSYIYDNSEFEVELGDLETIMGNANLKPEKTVSYEIGLQQQIYSEYGLDFTVYYKGIKNLLGQEIINTRDKKIYARYINRDYGSVKGFALSLKKQASGYFSGAIDYTYQIARGNASDPNSVFSDFQSHPPRESEKQVLPLDWDQTHTLNTSIYVGNPSNWNLGIIGRFSTGQPYTPTNPGSQLATQFQNSDRKPVYFNIDLTMYKWIRLAGYKVKLFCKVFNLTDRLNQRYVFTSTGTAEFPYRSNVEWQLLQLNPNFSPREIDLRPDYYSEPRRVLLGFSLDF